jgi:hypothetical protein
MVENDKKKKLLVLLSPRENEALEKISELNEKDKSINGNEAFRRGLSAFIQLIDVNEKPLLWLLVQKLDETIDNQNKENIESVKSLSVVIYATLIAKRGIGADMFRSIPQLCQYLDLIGSGKIDESQVKPMLHDLSTSVKTVFLNESRTSTLGQLPVDFLSQTSLSSAQQSVI